MNALISIIIPTFNRAHLIGETLDSIIAQTYANWECIIVDDGSSDNTEQLITEFIKTEPRIAYYKKPEHLPKGPSSARNYGLTKSQGIYINWFDSDDLMHPDKIKIDLKHITSGDYDFTITQSNFFTEDGSKPIKKYWNEQLWSEDPMNDFIMLKIGWSTNAPLWKRKSIENCRLKFNETLMTADDYLYHIQALGCSLKPIVFNEVLVHNRVHSQRLNEIQLKSPSKIIANNAIIKYHKSYKLSKKTFEFLNRQSLKQLCQLLKNKKLILYITFLFSIYKNNYKLSTKIRATSKFPFGLFYLLTNKGYKFLN